MPLPLLRPALDSDKARIFAIHAEVFRPSIEQIWGWDAGWQRENFNSEWNSSRVEVIECEGMMLGYVQTGERVDPSSLYVLSLALKPEHQRQGVGAWVMNLLMTRASERGLPIRLNVFPMNDAALRFYDRLGFVRVGATEHGLTLGWQRLPSSER